MTDTTTDKGLVERARFLASGQDDPHSVTIDELCDRVERLEQELLDRVNWWTDEYSKQYYRAEDAESRLSRITAPVKGMGLETTEEQWANWRKTAEAYERSGERFLPVPHDVVLRLLRDLETLSARLRVAEEALEPFANAAEDWSEMGDTRPISEDGRPTVGDLRRAASIRARGES